jgi:hypothetical protein
MKSYDILNFRSIYFHIADKIFEQTTCENKSLRELPFFNLQFLFASSPVSKKYQRMSICTMTLKVLVKSTQDVDIWMEIPIQHEVYIWVNYSVLSYLNFIQYFEMC